MEPLPELQLLQRHIEKMLEKVLGAEIADGADFAKQHHSKQALLRENSVLKQQLQALKEVDDAEINRLYDRLGDLEELVAKLQDSDNKRETTAAKRGTCLTNVDEPALHSEAPLTAEPVAQSLHETAQDHPLAIITMPEHAVATTGTGEELLSMLGPVVSTLERVGPSLERLSDMEAQLQEVAGLKAQMAAVLQAMTGRDKPQINQVQTEVSSLSGKVNNALDMQLTAQQQQRQHDKAQLKLQQLQTLRLKKLEQTQQMILGKLVQMQELQQQPLQQELQELENDAEVLALLGEEPQLPVRQPSVQDSELQEQLHAQQRQKQQAETEQHLQQLQAQQQLQLQQVQLQFQQRQQQQQQQLQAQQQQQQQQLQDLPEETRLNAHVSKQFRGAPVERWQMQQLQAQAQQQRRGESPLPHRPAAPEVPRRQSPTAGKKRSHSPAPVRNVRSAASEEAAQDWTDAGITPTWQGKAWKCEVCCIGFDRKVDLLQHLQDKDEDGHLEFVKEIIGYSYGKDWLTGKSLTADQMPRCPYPRFNRRHLGLSQGSSGLSSQKSTKGIKDRQCPVCDPERYLTVYELLVHQRSKSHRETVTQALREEQ